ncbi:MAG: hypothetical protein ACREQW_19340, partial [Candidatus Binatia bacterium]
MFQIRRMKLPRALNFAGFVGLTFFCIAGGAYAVADTVVAGGPRLTLIGAPSHPPPELRWAGDSEGGAPFVEANPANPDELVGFDVEIADLIARGLGRKASFINIA